MLSWDSNSPRSQLWLTILTCFGAGVILTTTVTHMMPEVSHFIRYNIEHGIQARRVTQPFHGETICNVELIQPQLERNLIIYIITGGHRPAPGRNPRPPRVLHDLHCGGGGSPRDGLVLRKVPKGEMSFVFYFEFLQTFCPKNALMEYKSFYQT